MTWWSSNDNCLKCGYCADVCPVGAIGFDAGPLAEDSAVKRCTGCGACVAVCKQRAVSNTNTDTERFSQIDPSLKINGEQISQHLRARRSVRRYKNKPVDPAIIEQLLETSGYAPSGLNSQPLEWIAVSDEEKRKSLASATADWMRYMVDNQPEMAAQILLPQIVQAWDNGMDLITYNAPVILINHCHKDNPFGQATSPNSITYVDVAATAYGLGTCWAGFLMMATEYWPPMKGALGLAEDQTIHGVALCGYPKYKYIQIPARKKLSLTWM